MMFENVYLWFDYHLNCTCTACIMTICTHYIYIYIYLIGDGIFCTFEALNSYCPEDRQTYLKFHSIDPCYKDGCKFTTEVVSCELYV